MSRIPVTVVGGYLGSGKTTLINHLLRHADGHRLAILVNEFGELPIDADLIEAQDEEIISIAGGCVCCSYGNDMTLALVKLTEVSPAPDQVLIEASGVALPDAIARAVELLPGFVCDGVVVVCDAETVRRQVSAKYVGDTVAAQLRAADLLLLNKSDLAAPADLADWLDTAAPGAARLACTFGQVSPPLVLGNIERLAKPHSDAPVHANPYAHVILDAKGADPRALAQAIAMGGFGVVRAKGFVGDSLIQIVGQRWRVTQSQTPPAQTTPGRIVCIGPKAELDAEGLAQLVEPKIL